MGRATALTPSEALSLKFARTGEDSRLGHSRLPDYQTRRALTNARLVAMQAEPFVPDRPPPQRDECTVSAQHASDITLVDVAAGQAFPCAPAGSVLLSSVLFGWRGIIVERHRLEPKELPEHP